jgi:hypothetical protein
MQRVHVQIPLEPPVLGAFPDEEFADEAAEHESTEDNNEAH